MPLPDRIPSVFRKLALAACLGGLVAISACDRPNAPPGVVTDSVTAKSNAFDVPFVPSHDRVLAAMFELGKPTAGDFVIDLGSGDGRIVIAAAAGYGARGFGVDLNDELVKIANYRARKAGVADRARFYVRDLFETDIRQATLLTMYLLPDIVLRLRPKLLRELRPGTRIVSHDFHLGDWRADAVRTVGTGALNTESTVYLWIVPAEAEGIWQWTTPRGPAAAASIRQSYQSVTGEVRTGRKTADMDDARLDGARIRFSLAPDTGSGPARLHFDGIIEGDRIDGTVTAAGPEGEAARPWRARRTGPLPSH